MAEPLPLFPLDTVLFPGMLMPLHIFEPRYRLLVRRSLEKQRPFGIVLARDESGGEPYGVGTSATIVAHTPLPDGRSFIVVRGLRRFAIASVDGDAEPYLVGQVEYLDEEEGEGAGPLADLAADAFSEYLNGILAASNEARTDAPGTADIREGSAGSVAYRVAGGLAIDAEERQRLLEARNVEERLRSEVRLLVRENALLKELLLRMRMRGEGPALN